MTVDHNDMSRKVTIGHYITTAATDLQLEPCDSDRFVQLQQVIGDLAYTIRHGDRDMFEVLGVAAAHTQKWMELLLKERAR